MTLEIGGGANTVEFLQQHHHRDRQHSQRPDQARGCQPAGPRQPTALPTPARRRRRNARSSATPSVAADRDRTSPSTAAPAPRGRSPGTGGPPAADHQSTNRSRAGPGHPGTGQGLGSDAGAGAGRPPGQATERLHRARSELPSIPGPTAAHTGRVGPRRSRHIAGLRGLRPHACPTYSTGRRRHPLPDLRTTSTERVLPLRAGASCSCP